MIEQIGQDFGAESGNAEIMELDDALIFIIEELAQRVAQGDERAAMMLKIFKNRQEIQLLDAELELYLSTKAAIRAASQFMPLSEKPVE